MDFLTIVDLFSSSYFAVPDYQRDYSWKKSETAVLVDDVLAVMNEEDETTHFLGAIVTVPFDADTAKNMSIKLKDYKIKSKNVKHIVDGQQRLATFTLFLKVVDDLIKNNSEKIPDADVNAFHKKLSDLYLGSNHKKRDGDSGDVYEYAPRLILNGNTGNYYNNTLGLSAEDSNGKLTGARRLRESYNYIKNELENHCSNWLKDNSTCTITDYFEMVCDTLTEAITFVEIACDAATNAFQVFDSLNGKGLDLTVADRIKNLIMSWSPQGEGNEKWDELVKAIGESNLTHFFVAYHFYYNKKRISKNKLPEEFKRLYADSNFNAFYKDLMKAGKMFASLKGENTGNKTVDQLLNGFNTLQFDQPYNLLFAVKWGLEEEIKTEPQQFEKLVKSLLNLVVRMQVCEISMNKLDSKFIECITAIRNPGTTLDMITNKIEGYKNVTVSDEQFQSAFVHFCPTDSATEYYYLSALENYKRRNAHNRNSLSKEDNGDKVTVEHIIPQGKNSWRDWYGGEDNFPFIGEESFFSETIVENIGNKLLLYGDDNTSASDEVFETKRKVYKEGKKDQTKGTPVDTFQLVKEFLDNDDFKEQFLHNEVKIRAELLSKDAIKIWS